MSQALAVDGASSSNWIPYEQTPPPANSSPAASAPAQAGAPAPQAGEQPPGGVLLVDSQAPVASGSGTPANSSAPAAESTPTNGSTPANSSAPAAESTPTNGSTPANSSAPAAESTPTNGSTPANSSAPAAESVPANGSLPTNGLVPAAGSTLTNGPAPANGSAPAAESVPANGSAPAAPSNGAAVPSQSLPFIPGLTSPGVSTATVGSVQELLLGPTGRDPNTPSLLSPELVMNSIPVSRPTAGLAADDPRVALMQQGYSVQEINQAVAALQSAPIDIEGAQAGVTTATENEQQFWTGVYNSLTSEQLNGLRPLAEAIESAPDPAAAQSAFDSQLAQLLSPEQLAELRTLQRASEDAQLNLQGQQLGQRLRETQLSSTVCAVGADQITQDPYSLAQADARVFISEQRQILANRRVEDAMTTLMTPETQQALAPQQQSVIDAIAAVRANPNDAGARQRLETAQLLFDHALSGQISASDKTALDGLIEAAESESALGSVLSGEAATQHRLMDLSVAAESRGGSLNETERKIWDLARGEYEIVVQNRNLRDLAVTAATSENSEELLGELNGAIGEVLTARADQAVNQAQFELDVATYLQSTTPPTDQTNDPGSELLGGSPQPASAEVGGENPQVQSPPPGSANAAGELPQVQSAPPGSPTVAGLIPQAGSGPVTFEGLIPQAVPASLTPASAPNGQPQPLTVGAEFAAYLPSSIPSVADATSFLNIARTERDELQDELNPETPQKGFWERALDVGMGVGEVAAGVAIMAAAGWTGVGAVAGGAIVAHGLMNTVHSATDWATNAETATPLSRGLQTLGVDEGAADRIDMGVSMVGMTAAGGLGAASLLLRGGGLATKAAGGLSGALVVDSAQAQGRYVFANDAVDPYAVDGLTALGLSHTQANYALLGGSMVAVGGLAALGRRGGGSSAPVEATTTSADAVSPSTDFLGFRSRFSNSTDFSELQTRLANGEQIHLDQLRIDPEGGVSILPATEAASGRIVDAALGNHFADMARRAEILRTEDPAGLARNQVEPPTDVAIIGVTGNVGMTTLADIVGAGADGLSGQFPRGLVRPSATVDRIAGLEGPVSFNETLRGGVHEVTLTRDNFAYLNTEEGIQALQQAGTIVISAPDVASSRMALFNDLNSYGVLSDPNKVVVLIRAGQGGQPAWSAMIRNDPSIQATLVGVEDSPYGTRVMPRDADGLVVIRGKRKNEVEISIAGNPDLGLTALQNIFPRGAEIGRASWPDFTVVPGSAMPWRAGFFIHPGVALWPSNLTRTINGQQYLHYAEGVVDATHGDYLQALDNVKVELGQAYGASPETFAQKLKKQFGLELIPDEPFHETMARTVDRPDMPLSKKIYTSVSYPNLSKLLGSRYIDEDLASAFTMRWYADRAGLRFPALDRYLTDSVDTLLGPAGMTEAQVNSKLHGYLPYLDEIPGNAPEIIALLDDPHAR